MVLCAAVKVRFERNGKIIETVVPGFRHADCQELMATLLVPFHREEEDGFFLHDGSFVDRYEAYSHALMCGQISNTVRTYKAEKGKRLLYSEDIY